MFQRSPSSNSHSLIPSFNASHILFCMNNNNEEKKFVFFVYYYCCCKCVCEIPLVYLTSHILSTSFSSTYFSLNKMKLFHNIYTLTEPCDKQTEVHISWIVPYVYISSFTSTFIHESIIMDVTFYYQKIV